MDIDNPDDMTLELFCMWKVDALKRFLEKRGLSKEGTKHELAALCYAANKLKIPTKLTSEEIIAENARKYKDLLFIGTEGIPDPFKLCEGWFGEKDGLYHWPPIYLSDITKFLVVTDNENAEKHLNSYKSGKAYGYFISNWMKEVYYHYISASSRYCLLRSQCCPSQRVSDTDHGVWVSVEKASGSIMSAYCSCTAGLGQTCNHIAAMLFRIEHSNRMGFSSAACTSLPCTWNIPGEKVKYGPQQVCDLLPKKSKHGKSASSRPLVRTKKKLFQPITQPPQTNPLESLGEALIDILPKACLFKGYTPKVGSTSMSKNQTERPRDDHNLSSNDANLSAGEEKTNHTDNIQADCYSISEHAKKFTKCEGQAFFATLSRLEEKEILAVAKATGQQSLSPLWHTLRRGRITASRFYAVHTKVNDIKKADKDIDTKPLLKVLKGESGLSDDPAKLPRAMKHGLEMEPTAKVQFYEGNKQHHQNFIVENCGFFIHPTKSFLGASPDMLSSCSCCGEGIVEIKCPVIPPCNTCHTTMCSCYGKGGYANGNPFLKQNHAYYAQIQGQMAVTGRHFCDFYVYTTYATFQQRILFNSIYWENVCSNLDFFFLKYMVPDMLQASSTDTQTEDDRDVEDMETDDQMGNVFFCPICHQVIKEQENISSFGQRSVCCDLCDKWHHFKCIKMSKASLKSLGDWICSSCNSS